MKKIISILCAALLCFSVTAFAKSNPPAQQNATVDVLMVTNMGNIELQLSRAQAPITVKNFLSYVKDGTYNGLIFHRVISGFMIQGGGFNSDMEQAATGAPIQNEAGNGLTNKKYTIAMARTNDPNSATDQFFINTNDNKSLDFRPGNPGYAVFGKVIKGQNVVDKIEGVDTTTRSGYQDVPVKPVIIEKVTIVKN